MGYPRNFSPVGYHWAGPLVEKGLVTESGSSGWIETGAYSLVVQLDADQQTGGVASINVTAGGTGYTTADVAISGSGRGGAATATIVDGVITAITVTEPGSDYTDTAIATITGDGTGATAVCV